MGNRFVSWCRIDSLRGARCSEFNQHLVGRSSFIAASAALARDRVVAFSAGRRFRSVTIASDKLIPCSSCLTATIGNSPSGSTFRRASRLQSSLDACPGKEQSHAPTRSNGGCHTAATSCRPILLHPVRGSPLRRGRPARGGAERG